MRRIAIACGLLAAIAVAGLGLRDSGKARLVRAPDVARPGAAMGSVSLDRMRAPVVVASPPTRVALADGVLVEGTVRDLFGNLVAGVAVSSPDAAGVSDGAGRFALTVPAGPVVVRAEVEGYAPAVREGTAPARGLELVLVPEAELGGVVVARATRTPVAGVNVVGRGIALDGLGLPPVARATTTTDAEGRFTLAGLAPGRYALGVEAPGFDAAPLAVDARAASPVHGLVLEVDVAPVARAEVAAAPGAGLRVRGRATDADGRPLVGAVIAVEPGVVDVRTDLRGAFEAGGLEPGDYALAVMSEDRRELSRAVAVAVRAGAAVPEVNLVADPAARLRGTIAGAPPGAALTAFATGGDGRVAQTRVAADGAFAFDDLAPGPHQVTICDPWAGAIGDARAIATLGRPGEVRVSAIAFDAAVTGTVVDADGELAREAIVTAEAPAAPVPVRVHARSRTAVATDGDGRFRLPALPARTYTLHAVTVDGAHGAARATAGARAVITLGQGEEDDPDAPPSLLDRR